MIDFPSSPTIGQTYTVGSITWKWNGTGWAKVVNTTPSIFPFAGIFNVETYVNKFSPSFQTTMSGITYL